MNSSITGACKIIIYIYIYNILLLQKSVAVELIDLTEESLRNKRETKSLVNNYCRCYVTASHASHRGKAKCDTL